MDQAVQHALEHDRLVDITTTGRKTGQSRRKEIAFHLVDGKLYLTGRPGRRGWYANLVAHPDFTFHLKQSLQRDVSARATPVTDKSMKRQVLQRIKALEGERMRQLDVDEWTAGSPLVEVALGPGS